MSGKLISLFIIAVGLIAGGAMYYFQIYGFYEEVVDGPEVNVALLRDLEGAPEAIPYSGFEAIDADSSPIRFRACFDTDMTLEAAKTTYVSAGEVVPRNAPEWFDCFDAEAIANQMQAGTAEAFMGQKNIRYGVDRIVVITDAGRGYIWHELNDCGAKAYDGTVVGEECPPLPDQN